MYTQKIMHAHVALISLYISIWSSYVFNLYYIYLKRLIPHQLEASYIHITLGHFLKSFQGLDIWMLKLSICIIYQDWLSPYFSPGRDEAPVSLGKGIVGGDQSRFNAVTSDPFPGPVAQGLPDRHVLIDWYNTNNAWLNSWSISIVIYDLNQETLISIKYWRTYWLLYARFISNIIITVKGSRSFYGTYGCNRRLVLKTLQMGWSYNMCNLQFEFWLSPTSHIPSGRNGAIWVFLLSYDWSNLDLDDTKIILFYMRLKLLFLLNFTFDPSNTVVTNSGIGDVSVPYNVQIPLLIMDFQALVFPCSISSDLISGYHPNTSLE